MRERYEVEDISCDNCRGKNPMEKWILLTNGVWEYDLCSLSCLNEYSWKLREAQPKLSKSKVVETNWGGYQAADGTREPNDA